MEELSDAIQKGNAPWANVLTTARAMNQSWEILKPELVMAGAKPVGKPLLGMVKGNPHDIGKNPVKMMAQGERIDVSSDKFLQGLNDNPDAKAIRMLVDAFRPDPFLRFWTSQPKPTCSATILSFPSTWRQPFPRTVSAWMSSSGCRSPTPPSAAGS